MTGGWALLRTLKYMGQSPATKNYPAQKADGTRVENFKTSGLIPIGAGISVSVHTFRGRDSSAHIKGFLSLII